MFALLAVVTPAINSLIVFLIVAVAAGYVLANLPKWVTIKAGVYKLIVAVVVVFLILWALSLFGIL